jgi:predicted nucleic acid-binding protein
VRYLLDTCVLSELTKPRADKHVAGWLESQHSENLYISVYTIGELNKGIWKLSEGKKKKDLHSWLESIMRNYKDRIIPMDIECSITWGTLVARFEKKGNPMAAIDSLIAAQALHYGFTIATGNLKDFEPSGVQLINPWK